MLLSIYFLPKYVGIYSLLIGFSFVYGLTTILNVILLRKKCTEKPKFIKFILSICALTAPSILLGCMLEKLLLPVLGTIFTFLVCSAITVAFTILLFVGFNLLDISVVVKRLKRKTA